VIDGADLPTGWVGKAWALQQGLLTATGDVVVMLDADTRPRRGLAGALAGALGDAPRTIVSAGPRYACASPGERVVHPALLATLVYRFGPTDVEGFVPRPSRALLNGQCIVARRAELLAAGGLEPVRGSLAEDVALARLLARDGWRVGFVDASALLEVAGYGSARGAWDGWGRTIATPDATPAAWQAADLAVLWLALALPLPLLLARHAVALNAALVALRLALAAGLAGSYRPRGAAFWLAPLADLPVVVRFTLSALRPSRTWRGRTYGG
jgi:dolichol-phosphate mannosyltransferase